MGTLFYIMGKSATGKDHIYRALLADDSLGLRPLILYTTRPMRSGEADGREYYFTTSAELQRLRETGRVIEERVYRTACGPWHYATVDDGQMDLAAHNYLSIGTLESFCRLRAYYGADAVMPLYIETEDGLRLSRALQREKKQAAPNYAELCRRFLADLEDFSDGKIASAGITLRIPNDGPLNACIADVKKHMLNQIEKGTR